PCLLRTTAPERLPALASGALGAILAHHGGWLPQSPDLGIGPLRSRWEADLRDAGIAETASEVLAQLYRVSDRRGQLDQFLAQTTSPERLEEWWPLVAYLVRTLRLADQRATAEGWE